MAELRTCFNSNAYKAAIILAGSILEAFLIDWLSKYKARISSIMILWFSINIVENINVQI